MSRRLLIPLICLLFAVTVTQSVVTVDKVSGLRAETARLSGEVGSGADTARELRGRLSTAESAAADLRSELAAKEEELAAARALVEVYERNDTISADTLTTAGLDDEVTVDLSRVVCAPDPDICADVKTVTVHDCDGDLCVSHDWADDEVLYDGTASGTLTDDSECESTNSGQDFTWEFTFTPTEADFDPNAGEWLVTEFDARLRLSKPESDCGALTAVWEVSGEPV